jgi:hypothetical protein
MTRDEYIQTEVMGKCWHELEHKVVRGFVHGECKKCHGKFSGRYSNPERPNYSTSHAYELQQFVLRADWWGKFHVWCEEKHYWMDDSERISANFTKWLFSDASRFADLVAEFRGWKDE